MKHLKHYFKNFLRENGRDLPMNVPKDFKQLYTTQDIKITLQLILIVLLINLLIKGV